jgi:hypothetical protein
LGVTLEKFGEGDVEGANRFDLQEVKIGGSTITNPTRTQEYMARSQYVNLNDEQKLSQPSFEKFDVGIAVGTQGYAISPATANADLNYETKYLTPGEGENEGLLHFAGIFKSYVTIGTLQVQASRGAAAQAELRKGAALRPAVSSKISISEPTLAAVNTSTLEVMDGIDGADDTNFTIMSEQVNGVRNAQIVETFELDR